MDPCIFRGSFPLSYCRACEIVLCAFEAIGISRRDYGLHILRAGGASAAANAQVADRLFKGHGRWNSEKATVTLFHALFTSHLDHCNSLLYGVPKCQIDLLQKVLSAASRVTQQVPKYRDITPGAHFLKDPRTFQARKAIRKSTTYLFCKAGLFICCKEKKNKNNHKVSCLGTPSF